MIILTEKTYYSLAGLMKSSRRTLVCSFFPEKMEEVSLISPSDDHINFQLTTNTDTYHDSVWRSFEGKVKLKTSLNQR